MSHAAAVSGDGLTAYPELASSTAIYQGQAIERLLRDGEVATQHAILARTHLDIRGPAMLGLDADARRFRGASSVPTRFARTIGARSTGAALRRRRTLPPTPLLQTRACRLMPPAGDEARGGWRFSGHRPAWKVPEPPWVVSRERLKRGPGGRSAHHQLLHRRRHRSAGLPRRRRHQRRRDHRRRRRRRPGPPRRSTPTARCVTPGFVDIHTHFDGQVCWDKQVTPSSWHGVTTVVMGNCGVGFAPVRPGTEDELVALMEAVEDIPGTALHEGIPWGWESFGEYLDAIDTPYSVDVGAQIPHVRPALLRDGRPLLRRRHRRRHRPHGRPSARQALRRRRARLLDVALLRPPRQGRQRRARHPRHRPTRWWPSPRPSRRLGHGTMEIISDHLDEPDELALDRAHRPHHRPPDHAAGRAGPTAASGSSPTA